MDHCLFPLGMLLWMCCGEHPGASFCLGICLQFFGSIWGEKVGLWLLWAGKQEVEPVSCRTDGGDLEPEWTVVKHWVCYDCLSTALTDDDDSVAAAGFMSPGRPEQSSKGDSLVVSCLPWFVREHSLTSVLHKPGTNPEGDARKSVEYIPSNATWFSLLLVFRFILRPGFTM